jgi:hypothetical protein
MEVLKLMIATTANRLPLGEGMVFRNLMQDQMEAMRSTISVFMNGQASRAVYDDSDDAKREEWRKRWIGSVKRKYPFGSD